MKPQPNISLSANENNGKIQNIPAKIMVAETVVSVVSNTRYT